MQLMNEIPDTFWSLFPFGQPGYFILKHFYVLMKNTNIITIS